MITPDVQMSKAVPSLTALRMPSGIETRVEEDQHPEPSDIETGSFSLMSCRTVVSRK